MADHITGFTAKDEDVTNEHSEVYKSEKLKKKIHTH